MHNSWSRLCNSVAVLVLHRRTYKSKGKCFMWNTSILRCGLVVTFCFLGGGFFCKPVVVHVKNSLCSLFSYDPLFFVVVVPFGTAVMVFAGQLFLRLISSKLFSAHTQIKQGWGQTSTDTCDKKKALKRTVRLMVGRKSVNGDQDNKILGVWRWPTVFLGRRSFVQATPVATRLWIVSQERHPYPPFPAPVQLFPVWNWLLSFGLIRVLWTEANVVPRVLKLCNAVLKLNTLCFKISKSFK